MGVTKFAVERTSEFAMQALSLGGGGNEFGLLQADILDQSSYTLNMVSIPCTFNHVYISSSPVAPARLIAP